MGMDGWADAVAVSRQKRKGTAPQAGTEIDTLPRTKYLKPFKELFSLYCHHRGPALSCLQCLLMFVLLYGNFMGRSPFVSLVSC
jgi:hypothetical protein